MTYNYTCPECHQPVRIDWAWLKEEILCPNCNAAHYPPTPGEDPLAYVDGDKWPKEMETIVIARHGTTCAAPGCYQPYTTLVHRQPLTKGGRTCVSNLLPMCAEHTLDKGEQEFDEWAASLKVPQAAAPVGPPSFLETTYQPSAQAPPVTPSPEPGYVQPLASGASVAITPGAQPVLVVPFLRGNVHRLVFDYDWSLVAGTGCRVFLVAWSHGQRPNLAELDSPQFDGLTASLVHSGRQDESGTSRLELLLPSAPLGRWTAAVLLSGDSPSLTITEFVLAGAE